MFLLEIWPEVWSKGFGGRTADGFHGMLTVLVVTSTHVPSKFLCLAPPPVGIVTVRTGQRRNHSEFIRPAVFGAKSLSKLKVFEPLLKMTKLCDSDA